MGVEEVCRLPARRRGWRASDGADAPLREQKTTPISDDCEGCRDALNSRDSRRASAKLRFTSDNTRNRLRSFQSP